jgi:FkbM family methyltransferase
MTPPQRDLIFDLGMHIALDTDFYLKKGFRVVALEANPPLVNAAREKYASFIASGQLSVVEHALWKTSGEEISFYLNATTDDWSSVFKDWAAKGGHAVEEIRVSTVTLTDLFNDYGVPYYIKCDVEGVDELFARQLMKDHRRPEFVSIEAISLKALAFLIGCEYDAVQIVNQALNWRVRPPVPSREGHEVTVTFNGHMSGLFGHDLAPNKWLSFDVAADQFLSFTRLATVNGALGWGWLDFHVTTRVALDRIQSI